MKVAVGVKQKFNCFQLKQGIVKYNRLKNPQN